MEQRLFFIKTFGCQMNIRDSEIMAQKLSEHGYIECAAIDEAQLILINTCSVRAKAEQKVFSLLGSLRKLKKQNSNLKICVAGCVAQQEGQNIIDRMPHVDLVVGTQHIYNLPELLEKIESDKTAINLADDYEIPRYYPLLTSATSREVSAGLADPVQFSRFVTIMQGCDNFCTYCVVPHTRGREVSRQATDIIDEVTHMVNSGVQEITLLGQNVNSYGRANVVTADGLPYSFASLLRDVSRIKGLSRLRFTTSHPKDLSDELIDCFAEIDVVCPQFHLPVQSGSNSILRRMNRKYTVEEYLEKVDKLFAACPGLALTTDMIIGFPGETDEDFRATMDLLERVRYHGSFSFKYSDRPGTRARDFAAKVAEDVKSERLQVFQQRQDKISLERNSSYVGQTLDVLVESFDVKPGTGVGRSATNHVVHFTGSETAPIKAGHFVDVLIESAGQHSLKGCFAGTL